jgi:hypothetical protein
MAGDNLNVWYDPEGDHLEIVFDQKAGYFEDTPLENVMRKRDADGNLLAVSILNLSSFARRESPSAYGLWTIANLDVEDGQALDFEVALGYMILEEGEGEVEPGNTSIDITKPDARATCSIFFHAERQRPWERELITAQTLEIAHKPLARSVASQGEDPLLLFSLVTMCRDQLLLSLRLFQSQSLFLFPRAQRRAGLARSFLATSPLGMEPSARYVFRGQRIAKFIDFTRRLREFHRDRNHYRFCRWNWLGSALADNPDEMAFLKRSSRLMIATDLYDRANNDPAIPGDIRLLWLVMAAEALFADDDKSELSYRLATRVAFLNGGTIPTVKEHFDLVRLMYEARSKLVHGTSHIAKPKGRLVDLVGDDGYIKIPPDYLFRFSNLIRASILYFIAFQDRRRDEVLEALDRSVFDASEVAPLRRRANEYWGLPGHEEEMLCSERWLD